jgi:hypothetical protein
MSGMVAGELGEAFAGLGEGEVVAGGGGADAVDDVGAVERGRCSGT